MAYNETYFVFPYMGVAAIWSSDLEKSNEYTIKQPSDFCIKILDRNVTIQMSGLG